MQHTGKVKVIGCLGGCFSASLKPCKMLLPSYNQLHLQLVAFDNLILHLLQNINVPRSCYIPPVQVVPVLAGQPYDKAASELRCIGQICIC